MSTEVFNRAQAARFLQSMYGLHTTKGSLATMATRGGGPRMIKFGRYIHYSKCDLLEWVRSRCSGFLDSTSTPHNGNMGSLFVCHEDGGDLTEGSDYHNTGDPHFDKITRLEEQGFDIDAAIEDQQKLFNYHETLEKMIP